MPDESIFKEIAGWRAPLSASDSRRDDVETLIETATELLQYHRATGSGLALLRSIECRVELEKRMRERPNGKPQQWSDNQVDNVMVRIKATWDIILLRAVHTDALRKYGKGSIWRWPLGILLRSYVKRHGMDR
jgi:hypothetical protein